MKPEEWEILPTTKNRILREVRESIENSFSLVKNNVIVLADKGGFSFDSLNLRLSKSTGDTVNSAFKAKIENLKRQDRIATMLICNNVLNNIESFSGKKISFESIFVDYLKRFEKHFLIDKNHTTVAMQMLEIRTIMNEAKKAGVIKDTQYPFGKDK